jgi:hypothetical protein
LKVPRVAPSAACRSAFAALVDFSLQIQAVEPREYRRELVVAPARNNRLRQEANVVMSIGRVDLLQRYPAGLSSIDPC